MASPTSRSAVLRQATSGPRAGNPATGVRARDRAVGGGRDRRHARRLSPEARERLRRERSDAARRRSGEPHLTFTTRAAALALSLCAVLLTLAYPLKEYFAQRGQINSERAQSAALAQQVTALTKQHAQAQTPAQIEAEARLRLHYTFPGQQNYILVSPKPVAKPTVTKKGHAKVPIDPHATWYQRLWDSDIAASKG